MQAQALSLIVYPSGIRHTWIQTSSCRMLIIPRAALATAQAETGLDLRSPSLNILIKLMSMVAIVMAGLTVSWSLF